MNAHTLTIAQQARDTFERLTPQEQLSFLVDVMGGNLGPCSDAWADAIAPVSDAFDAAYKGLRDIVDPDEYALAQRRAELADAYGDYRYEIARDARMEREMRL